MPDTKTPMYLKVSYEAHLPCFKQGDDLASAMESHPTDLAAAFKTQANAYDDCANWCRRLAGLAAEYPGLEVGADSHMIEVTGDAGRLEALRSEGLLQVSPFEEEERECVGEAFIDQLVEVMGEGVFTLEEAMKAVAGVGNCCLQT